MKTYPIIFACMLIACTCTKVFSQVSLYTFTSSSGTFSSIAGSSGTVTVTTTADDENYGTFPIGFTFTYNGNNYSTFGLNANGFIALGYVPVTTNNALSSGLNNNIISGFNNDLYGIASGAQISYQTSGSTGSRILTVEWTNWGFFSTGANEFTFQIRLFETSNKIQIVFGNCPGTTTKTLQIGLRGQTNTDFNNRSTTTNWSSTVAGTVDNSTCTFSSSVKPSSGLTFEWNAPAPTPRTCGTISSVQQTGNAAPGTTGNTILRIDIPITGSLGTLTLSSMTVISKNTTDNDISSSGVKVWTGTTTAPANLVGSASFNSGSAIISGLNTSLITGTNYIWITFDLKITAVVNDVLDARINAGGMNITASGGAANAGTQPATTLNPTGNRTVNYCTPLSTNGGCGGDEIFGFTYNGINYSTSSCLSSPGYLDVATTGTTTQGQTNSFTLTLDDLNDYAAIWIDYNDNASFDDAGELVYSGGPGPLQSGNIPIPVSAPPGTHRLRVRDSYGPIPPSSCADVEFGETKDFRLTINQAFNCSGTPATSATLSSMNPVCSGVNFTLSLSTTYLDLGITYQWQSSSDGVNYSNISGASSTTYTTTLNASTYYRCRVKCTNSGGSIFSTPLQVNLNSFLNCFCNPSGTDCSEDYITSVSFGGMNNTTACISGGYVDYSSMTGNATQGLILPVSVGVSDGGTEYVDVWIDYNHNAVFDANERTSIGSGIYQVLTGNVQIPANALTGITRMRIRLEFAFEPTDPCQVYSYGETEDYSVSIAACTPVTYFADADGDAYGNPGSSVVACSQPLGYVSNNTDCNDGNAAIHPNAAEICNGIDDNCNSQIDEGLTQHTYYTDADADGYGNPSSSVTSCSATAPPGYVSNNTDCNDANPNVYPGATEICNGIDDNCNSQIDEGLTQHAYYADADVDGYGNPSSSITSCSATAPPGYVSNNTDCNDANPNVHPGAVEVCNSLDDNCNNQIDEGLPQFTYYADADVDGYGNPSSSVTSCSATAPPGYVSNNTDCNDSNPNVHPGAVEICNSIDDNCNGQTDEGGATATITPSGTVNICAGTTITLQANTGAGFTYRWNKNGAKINGATNSTYTTAIAASYTVLVSSGTCSATSFPTIVAVTALPSATISPSGTITVCPAVSVTFQANTGAGLSYQWRNSLGNISGATGSSYTTSAMSTYKVIVTNSTGCSKMSAGTKLSNYPAAQVQITNTGSLHICTTGSVTLNAKVVTGYSYKWYKDGLQISGATQTSYVATQAGTYYYQATTSNGCSKNSASKTVIGCKTELAESNQLSSHLHLYPNPNNGNFVIEAELNDASSESADIQIINWVGQVVYADRVQVTNEGFQYEVKLDNMPAGAYLVRIISDDGQVYTGQIICQK